MRSHPLVYEGPVRHASKHMSVNIHVTMHNICTVLHDPTATLYLAFILPTIHRSSGTKVDHARLRNATASSRERHFCSAIIAPRSITFVSTPIPSRSPHIMFAARTASSLAGAVQRRAFSASASNVRREAQSPTNMAIGIIASASTDMTFPTALQGCRPRCRRWNRTASVSPPQAQPPRH